MKAFQTNKLGQVQLATEVASILPAAARRGRADVVERHRGGYKSRIRNTFCPLCGGDKNQRSATCIGCYKSQRSKTRRVLAMPRSVETNLGVTSTRHVHSAGTPVAQPRRPRMVNVDGVKWIAEGES